MKRFYASLAALVLVISGILLFNFFDGTSNAALPRDCDNNSIIYCGAITPSELASRYNANKTGDLKTIYHSYGLTDYEMTHAGTAAKMGEIHRDGRVTVDGKLVATGATSIGRQDIYPHRTKVTIGGKTYYEGEGQYTYAKGVESIVAYVFFDNDGNFKAAVMTSCGNAVHAKPKKPVYTCDDLTKTQISRTDFRFKASASAKDGATIANYTYDFGDGSKKTTGSSVDHSYAQPGTYTATVTVNVKANGHAKSVTGPKCKVQLTVAPAPAYVCDSLTADKISRDTYSFNGQATAKNGAEITGYTFDFGDGQQKAVDNPTDVQHTYAKAGTYTAQLTVTVKVNGETKTVTDNVKCVTKVTVSPEECKPGVPVGSPECTPCEIPGKEQYPKNSPKCVETPPELPHTGPTDLIGGTLGLGSLITAIAYYVASRRGLMSQLLNR